MRWTLEGVRGPGHFALWQAGTLDGLPNVLFTTRVALPQSVELDLVHAHANWAFSSRGVYCLDFVAEATRADRTVVRTPYTVTYAIDVDDPASAVPAPAPRIFDPSPTRGSRCRSSSPRARGAPRRSPSRGRPPGGWGCAPGAPA